MEKQNLKARMAALTALREAILYYEKDIKEALFRDLGKSASESYLCEVGLALKELSHTQKHLKVWMKPKRVTTGIANFPAKSRIYREPYGRVLIMSPWNYPFLLTIDPLIGALAGGNQVVLKPSNYSPETSHMIVKVVERAFSQEQVMVVEGGRDQNTALLEEKFDYIFFTGSAPVGRIVMEKAAAHLTPISLELGGKSPCIVDETANLKLAARRIANGKFLNCGQTCVAPDYLLIHHSVKEQFLQHFTREITAMFGENPLDCATYGKIINKKHLKRLQALIASGNVYFGGQINESLQKIAPTVLVDVRAEDPIMQEEIFGPILPVMVFEQWEEVTSFVREREKPLAAYLFTENGGRKKEFVEELSFGGGCINDTVMHLVSENLGFGGVGESGMGNYHGKHSFDTFTHEKSILEKSTLVDMPMRYQPYNGRFDRLVRFLLK